MKCTHENFESFVAFNINIETYPSCLGGEKKRRAMDGARWIPDWHLAVKLLKSPKNEDGYTSVHFAFPILAGFCWLFLSPALLLFFFFFFFFLPPSFRHRYLVREDVRSEIWYSRLLPLLLLLLLAG